MSRRVSIPAGLADMLAERLGGRPDDALVFSQKNGLAPRTVRWVINLQNKACAESRARRFTPHGYRHWRACKWADEGAQLSKIRAWLGHENLRTTERYLRSLGMNIEDL